MITFFVHFYFQLFVHFYIDFNRATGSKIKFNEKFGLGSKYFSGEDGLFLLDCLKKNLNIYASNEFIGKVEQNTSTWFNGYNHRHFFDRGALYYAISKRFYLIIGLYCLLRNKITYKKIGFFNAVKYIIEGKKAYLNGKTYNDLYSE